MDREKLKDTFDNVKPTHEQKERMLKNILGSFEEKNELKDSNEKIINIKTKKRKNLNKGLAIAACFGLIVIMGRSIYQKVERDDIVNEPPILEPEPVQDDIGMRKFLNFQGHRYVFIEVEEKVHVENRVEKELGILKYSLEFRENDLSAEELQRDNATTFGVGGKILKIKDTDSFFRIGIKIADDYYICENVGPVDNSPMDIEEFFRRSRLEEITKDIVVSQGNKNLKSLDKSESKKLIGVIRRAAPVQLSNDDYEKIGRAYGKGEDINIVLNLKDGTIFKMTYLEDLNLISIGDLYYKLNDFNANFGDVFEGLVQEPAPM